MWERDLSGIWFTGECERNISGEFALASERLRGILSWASWWAWSASSSFASSINPSLTCSGQRQAREWRSHVFFFFLSNWDGALRKLFSLHIVSFISHRPDRNGTLASNLNAPTLCTQLYMNAYSHCIISRQLISLNMYEIFQDKTCCYNKWLFGWFERNIIICFYHLNTQGLRVPCTPVWPP